MPRKTGNPKRDQASFDAWWSQRYFFTSKPFYEVYRKLYFKGGDLEFIDSLSKCLMFVDSLDNWRRESGGQRKSGGVPTKGKLRRSLQVLSHFATACVNFSREQKRKEAFSTTMKETLLGQLFISYATNPEDFRSGGKSDRNGSFFLLIITEHFREKKVKPRYLLAARLLRKIRGQQSLPSHLEATRAKIRIDQFKRLTPDWDLRLREFIENMCHLATT